MDIHGHMNVADGYERLGPKLRFIRILDVKPTAEFPKYCVGREDWIAYLIGKNGWLLGAELGVKEGRTFLHLLKTCPVVRMIGVDIWEPQPDNIGSETYADWPHEEFEKTVRRQASQFGSRATILKMRTDEAAHVVADGTLDFVFIDADHSAEAVRSDIINWWPKVRDTGWIIGHDIDWETVNEIVEELLPGYVVGPDNTWGRAKNPSCGV